MRHILPSIFASLVLTASGSLYAEQVRVPVGQQGQVQANLPSVGMSKSDVELMYGQPQSEKPSVGQPPISSWDYGNFVVFFEYNLVLHTVQKR